MTSAAQERPSRWAKPLAYLAFFIALGALIWSQLPRGAYPTDLTRVGAGRPAMVLAYDINSMGGMEAMKLLDALRGDYSARVEFLVADLGAPAGRSFAQRHDAVNGTVMVFAAEGAHLRTLHPPASTQALRDALEQSLPPRRGAY